MPSHAATSDRSEPWNRTSPDGDAGLVPNTSRSAAAAVA